jgi:hypothetical protein
MIADDLPIGAVVRHRVEDELLDAFDDSLGRAMDAQEIQGCGIALSRKRETPWLCRAFVRDGSDGARTRDLRRDRPAL